METMGFSVLLQAICLDLLLLKFVVFQFKSPLKAEVGNFFWEHFGFYYINMSTCLYDFLNFIIFPAHCVKLFLKGYTQEVCKAVKSVFFEDYRLNYCGICDILSLYFYHQSCVFWFPLTFMADSQFSFFLCLREGGGVGGGSKGLNTPLVIHLPTSLIQHNVQGCSYWA